MPNGALLTFSGNRKAVRIGLLTAMIRKAGPSVDEFVDLLEGKASR
jgi:hypothetical protein